MTPRRLRASLALLLVSTCFGVALSAASQEETVVPPETPLAPQGNVLLVILDDVGLDAVGCYPGSNDDAITPTMDRLAREGLRFETVWAYPACSPTRATIMTGKYGFRTGIGSIVKLKNDDPGLALDEICLPESIKSRSSAVRTAFLGKWHLSGVDHGPDNARLQGFDHFRGTVSNLGGNGEKDPYFIYDEIVDGKEQKREAYATTAVTDDALAAIERFGESPWLVVASYHAAHGPLHAPPKELRSIELSGLPKRSRHKHFAAMVEALDREIGRLWSSLPEATRARTTIIVVGDNGGASGQMEASFRQGTEDEKDLAGKGSLGESGLLVPLIIAGAGVTDPGRTISAIAGTSDLYDTAIELVLGAAPTETPDSVSLVPYLKAANAPAERKWIFAERFYRDNKVTKAPPFNRFAIRDVRYKLIEDSLGGGQRLYDLSTDPREAVNLLKADEVDEAAAAALARFKAVLEGPLGKERTAALKDIG